MNQETLTHLAKAKGIVTEYIDAWGNRHRFTRKGESIILQALGYPLEDEPRLTSTPGKGQTATLAKPIEPRVCAEIRQASGHFKFECRKKLATKMKWKITPEAGNKALPALEFNAESGALQSGN